MVGALGWLVWGLVVCCPGPIKSGGDCGGVLLVWHGVFGVWWCGEVSSGSWSALGVMHCLCCYVQGVEVCGVHNLVNLKHVLLLFDVFVEC